ncbi:MAG: hypothetical protein ACHQX1_00795 [Candidatus Micrarchaeales archaeon]
MDMQGDYKGKNSIAIYALNVGSLILIAGAIYLLKELSILYGIGVGAAIQSITDNAPLASLVSSEATQLTSLHTGIIESYVILLVALGLTGAAFVLYIKRHEKGNNAINTYALLHSGLIVVYLLMLYLIISTFSGNFVGTYMYMIYAGLVICILCDLYLQYMLRQPSLSVSKPGSKMKNTLTIDPSKPFSNIMALQDQLFTNMSGYLRVIDKHFNSAALANFHRLTEKKITNFTKITILTSKEMLDSGFGSNLTDFKVELGEAGVGLEVKLMDDKDTIEQHERILMDDKIAYKIPPFNIINKRSEHITRINFEEANKRFNYLYGRAIKMENYAIKRARDGNQPHEEQK